MAYNEFLGERLKNTLKKRGVSFEEKKMMGGLALAWKGCKPMDFTGRPMKGFVYVEPVGIDLDEDLEYWIQLALDFNPRARSSKKS